MNFFKRSKDQGELVSVEAAALELGCSRNIIMALIHNGKLTAHTVSSHGRTHQVVVRDSLKNVSAGQLRKLRRGR